MIGTQARDHPAAWTSAALGGVAAITRALSPGEVAAIGAAAERVAGRDFPDIGRSDFADAAIVALMDEVRDAVMHGRGAMLLTGLDPAAGDLARWERLHWGLGTHLGKGAIQGPAGDWVAHVHKDEDNPTGRGTLMDVELRPHTDFHEVMSLGAVSKPVEGGTSALVSATAVRDAIAADRPDLLAPLYEGYYYGINEVVGGEKSISDGKVPVFSERDGRLACLHNGFFMAAAAKRRGEPLPADLTEALAAFQSASLREDIALRFTLEPGEIVFWHNWTLLHARDAFRDGPGRKRLLTRLWINVPDGGRSVHPEVAERARQFDRDHARAAGIPVPA